MVVSITYTSSMMFIRNINRFAQPRARSFFSQARKSSKLSTNFKFGVGLGLLGGVTYALLDRVSNNQLSGVNSRIQLEDKVKMPEIDLQPPTKCDVFPKTLRMEDGHEYECLGTGVRAVTFLQMHVYAVGMYICTEDVAKAQEVLRSAKNDFKLENDAKLAEVLKTSDFGTEIITKLLDSHVRLAVRIVPVKNTDFNHMRDGMVSNIMNRPDAKSTTDPTFGEGIKQLKNNYGRKGKFPKGNIMTWVRDNAGNMDSYYGSSDAKLEHLCKVESNDVSKMFFLQYLTGEKPNSPTLKENTLNALAELAV